jgi:anthranilate phosphoribosyltransferase
VVKHGNRAVSSKSGASDFLEALGVFPGLNGAGVERTVRELGIGFCFAPVFHPAMRFAAPARKELGVPTVFNILGPLANPAQPKAAAIGVANERMHLVMAQVLADKGCDGFVFRGDDGLDEITLTTTTSVLSIGKSEIHSDRIDAKDFGMINAPIEALVGGDASENARISRAIFAGERGAPRDAVLLNAAAAIAAFEGDMDSAIKERLTRGLERAAAAVDSGAAAELLAKWAALTQEISAS